ncbi:MAG: hypothetical protein WBM13_06370 [Bacteroidia bacterium]
MKFKYSICLFSVLALSFKLQDKEVFTNFQTALKSPSSVTNLKLNGCDNIGNIEELEKIKLFKNLSSLEISECPTIKKLPDNLIYLSQLKRLGFYWNGGSGSEINWVQEFNKISKLKKLEILVLGPHNEIGELPSEICHLKSLKILNLTMTQTSTLPKEIINLSNLEELNLSMTPIKNLPSEMSRMKKLKKLNLMDTPISKDDSLKKKIIADYKNCEIIW